MNEKKEISPVGTAIPAREMEKSPTESITDNSENIKRILEKLTELLQMTRAGRDIESIECVAIYAIIHYKDGYEKGVGIGGDSGIAAICDIVNTVKKLM